VREMKKDDEKEASVFGELLGEIPEFRDPIKAVAEGAKVIMQK
jgi:methyl coenzyme M reductase beta subunit